MADELESLDDFDDDLDLTLYADQPELLARGYDSTH